MSKSASTHSCGTLEHGPDQGQSFKGDNGHFLCPIQSEDGFTYIGFVKNRDLFCQFFMETLHSGNVRLKDSKGFYLRRTDLGGRFPIEAREMIPDQSCEFTLFKRDGKFIFQGDNGLYLSRFTGGIYPTLNTLEACKKDADMYCEFLPEVLVKPMPCDN